MKSALLLGLVVPIPTCPPEATVIDGLENVVPPEAVEGVRKDLMDDKLPHRKMEEVEMADAFIRLLDFAGGYNISLNGKSSHSIFEQIDNKAESILSMVGSVHMAWFMEHNSNIAAMHLATTLVKIERYCVAHKLDLSGAIKEKALYNLSRKDHSHTERLKKNGKKF